VASSPGGARIPSLDGLRALSIALVLAGHLAGTRNAYRSMPLNAGFGVQIFFVISGFLITTLLLEEQANTGRISLKNFYIRRFFRIFPPFYAYIAAIAAVAAWGAVTLRPGDVLHSLTYTMNYHYDRSWWFGHIWSLSVEEQFYLLWPAILVAVGIRRGFLSAAAVILLSPAIRLGYWYLLPNQHGAIGEAFPTISDALAAGCLLAGVRGRLGNMPRYVAFLKSPLFYVVPACAILARLLDERPRFSMAVGQTIVNIAIAITIDRFVRFPDTLGGRFLNLRPVAYIGALSYSIYLWQQPFLNRHSDSDLAAFPLNLALTAGASLASYYLIERPFLDLRRRLENRSRPIERAVSAAPAGRNVR
jgi:peptidoglycan/LPS O-acetylase OafA/YrhL